MKIFYGITSLLCTAFAIALGARAIFHESVFWGLLYLLLTGLSAAGIILAFCAKCPAKRQCAHVMPGLAARIWNRSPGPYTRFEKLLTSFSMGLILLFPQYWLIRNVCLLVPFWALCLAGLMMIVRKICRSCKNRFCPYVQKKGNRSINA